MTLQQSPLVSDKTRPGRVIVIMGPPNAGKDTQAVMLAKKIGGEFIGSGDLLRREADPRIMAILAKGELAPSEDFRRLIGKAIAEVSLERPVVLAGIAKKPEEAHWLVEYLPQLQRWIDKVVLINIPMEVALERSRGRDGDRDDDHPDVQELRWNRFYNITRQSLDYFRNKGLLVEVSGIGSKIEVEARIEGVLV